MTRAAHLIPEIDRLASEVALVYKELVLPFWLSPHHGLPDTLFGYVMGAFSRIDLISAYWRGTFATQTERMVSFMETYMNPDRRANSLAVQIWRHKLMHTSSPRQLRDEQRGVAYRWLLHWGDDHLSREQHFMFQPGGLVLNMSLIGLIDDVRTATQRYVAELKDNTVLQQNYDAVDVELGTYKYRSV